MAILDGQWLALRELEERLVHQRGSRQRGAGTERAPLVVSEAAQLVVDLGQRLLKSTALALPRSGQELDQRGFGHGELKLALPHHHGKKKEGLSMSR